MTAQSTIDDLIKKYTDSMNDFKDVYDNGTDSAYGVWRAYERVIQDLKAISQSDGRVIPFNL